MIRNGFIVRVIVAISCAATVLAGCTHDVSGKKAFNSFDECMTANTLMGAGLGVLVGGLVGQKNRAAGTAAGVATAALVMYQAWQKCGVVYQKVEYIEARSRDQVLAQRPSTSPSLQIDELRVNAPKPGTDVETAVKYTLVLADAKKMDIPAVETRVFLIGEKQQDGSVKYQEIPFESKITINQGTRSASGFIPTPAELDPKLLYKFRFVIEAEGMRAQREVEFAFGKGWSSAADAAQTAQPVAKSAEQSTPSMPSASSSVAKRIGTTIKLPNSTTLYSAPAGDRLKDRVPAGKTVRILDATSVSAPGKAKPVDWVMLEDATGARGWAPANIVLVGAK